MSLRLRLLLSFSLISLAWTSVAHAGFGASAPVPIDPVRVAAPGPQDAVAAADNGTNTLYVWRDGRHGDGDIVGARVAHDGTVLDPNGIDIASGPGEQGQPAVAWSGTSWLVLWTNGTGTDADVLGARVGTDGVVLDGIPVEVSATPGVAETHPALAWNGELYIAVWQRVGGGESRIAGISIAEEGVPFSNNVAVSDEITDSAPVAAALGSNVLVAFVSGRLGGSHAFATRVTASIASPDPVSLDASDIQLSYVASRQTGLAVASNGSDWLVAWEDSRVSTDGPGIYGTRVSAAGVANDVNLNISIGIAGAAPAEAGVTLEYDGTRWLASWCLGSTRALRRIATNGNLSGAPGLFVNPAVAGDPGAAFGGDPATPLLAWVGSSVPPGAEPTDLFLTPVHADLGPGTTTSLSGVTPNQTEPAIAFGGGRWFIAWVDDRRGVLERQVRIGVTDSARFEAPNPATIRFAVPARAGLDQGHPTVAWDGSHFNLLWDESRGGHRRVVGARFTAGGAFVDTFDVATGAGNHYEPDACARDGYVFVVWTDTRNGAGERDIFARTIADGAVTFGEASVAVTPGVKEEAPRIAPLQDYGVLIAYEREEPPHDRGVSATSYSTPFWFNKNVFTVRQTDGLVYDHPDVASNGEDVAITYQEVNENDGPAVHTPIAMQFVGDATNLGCCNYSSGPSSYAPANPVAASAGYDFVSFWNTLSGGSNVDVVGRALDPRFDFPLGDAPLPLATESQAEAVGAASQGSGDRLGFTFTRALNDDSWSGLQLWGGDARDTTVGAVVINEFLANPPSGHNEFYELFNKGGRNYLLNGWQLVVGDDSSDVADCTIIFLNKTPGREQTFGNLCSELPDGDFAVDSTFAGRTPGPEGFLPNRGGHLRLYTPGGVLIDEVSYGYQGGAPVSAGIPASIAPGAALAPPPNLFEPQSAGIGKIVAAAGDSVAINTVRIPNGSDTDNDANDFTLSTNTTTNSTNQGTQAALGSSLYAVRIAWNPTVGVDAVELFNPSVGQTFDFTGWYISNNNFTERIGVPNNVFGVMKPGDRRVLRKGEAGSFTFDFDAISTLSLLDPNFTRVEQIGWTRTDNVTPDSCVTRVPDSGGFHDGYDWITSGGDPNYTVGAVRYSPCTIMAPSVDVPAGRVPLSLAGVWPNPSRTGQTPMLVFTVPGAPDGGAVRARIDLYDVAGRRVAGVLDRALTPGEHRIALPRVDAQNRALRPGVYYADFTALGERARKSIVILE